ncbi:M23 family metallopeptidase [Oceanithermus sp.]|uniref:M23 family metallopeptidase n=1 Tax=Oceanithermus sp. TaxID=2268145 RepID=UPI00257BBA0D|nr:M23 family metallopeptidase [Oceanithermus sp.]
MKRRVNERYTILITRTGREPLVVSFRPLALLLAALIVLVWTAASGYAYYKLSALHDTQQRLELLSEQARQLGLELAAERNRNENLAGQAAKMLEELDTLESEINRLRERAGLPKLELTPVNGRTPASEGQGGGGRPLSAEDLYNLTADRLKTLLSDLNGEVEPALQETLAKEAARPVGYPLKVDTYIASGFGTRRNPFGRGYEFHDGLDLPAWYGTPIYATAPGKVIEAGWSNIFGRYVKIDHGYGYRTLYGHMSKILVKRGQTVERGQVIGKVGSTGRSSGPHVHYSVFVWGKAVNPVPYLKAPSYANR